MKRILTLALIVTLLVFAMAGCTTGGGSSDSVDYDDGYYYDDSSYDGSYDGADVEINENSIMAEIEIARYGTVTVALDPDAAPITVANFTKLAKDGFYDGLTFHRIITNFMIQGGDPNGNGTGGSDENITGEFTANGIDNPLEHVRGALSMARSQANDSASSQFFIVHADSPHLNGQYAVFGYVTDGMRFVDAICENVVPYGSNGEVESADQPVITTVRILD